MNLHISVFCAAWVPLIAAWARAPPYRHDGLRQPLVELRQNECMSSLASGLTPEREDLSPSQQRSCEVRSKMQGIHMNTRHEEHSPTAGVQEHQGSAWQKLGTQDSTNHQTLNTLQEQPPLATSKDETRAEALQPDPAQDHPARRELEPLNPTGYQIQDYLQNQLPPMSGHQRGQQVYEGGPDGWSDVLLLMQQGRREVGWFEQARKGLSVLLARGTGRRAALQLRDQLRAYSSPELHRVIQAHLPGILDAEAQDDATVCLTEEGWVRHVLYNLARVAGLDDKSKLTLLGEYALDALEPAFRPAASTEARTTLMADSSQVPGGRNNDVQVDGRGPQASRSAENVSDQADSDANSLFQTEQEADLWESLMEQFWEWFSEGRAVDMALSMLRQRAHDRGDLAYRQWVREPINNLGSGLEANEQGTTETTPRDFYRWARRIESLLHSSYLRERVPVPGDESSLMDRYRNGRRRIRDSRTPRREARRPVCLTTETRRLEGRRPATSSGSAGRRGEADRSDRPHHGDARLVPRGREERASGSADVPRHENHGTGMVDPDLPDPQQPFTMEQALQMWKYLLFDRWVFSIPREGGRIPTSWLPRDTLNDINVHLGGMSNHNLLMMTTGLVTMVRYLMAELSQSLDMAQVVLNTRNGEPGVDLDEGDEEADETGLMQGFFASGGVDTADRRWSRAMMRLHKELEGQPKSVRTQSIARLRSALPPQQSGPQTSWQAGPRSSAAKLACRLGGRIGLLHTGPTVTPGPTAAGHPDQCVDR